MGTLGAHCYAEHSLNFSARPDIVSIISVECSLCLHCSLYITHACNLSMSLFQSLMANFQFGALFATLHATWWWINIADDLHNSCRSCRSESAALGDIGQKGGGSHFGSQSQSRNRQDTHTLARRHASANSPTSMGSAYQGLLNMQPDWDM